MSDDTREQATESKRELTRRLEAAGWGLFFIWIGVAMLASVGWGVTLLGVGVITLGGQLARKYWGLPVEGFWLIAGALFFFGGLWQALGLELGRAAIPGGLVVVVACILAGAVLLFSALFRRPAGRAGP